MTPHEFKSIYIPLTDSIYRVAFHLLESEQDAADVVQDVFLKLYSSLGRLDAVENPKAYAVTLTRNVCIDRIRSASRRRTEELDDGILSDHDVGDTLLQKERLRKVIGAMDSLSESQRTVLRLRIWEELPYEQISEITGINQLTLRVLLSQARAKLKKVLQNEKS